MHKLDALGDVDGDLEAERPRELLLEVEEEGVEDKGDELGDEGVVGPEFDSQERDNVFVRTQRRLHEGLVAELAMGLQRVKSKHTLDQ